MCANAKTGTRYSTVEDKHILKCVTESSTICGGINKAAKHLGRSENAVLQRYYLIKKNAKKASKKRTLPRSVGKIFNSDPFETFESKHQKMLDMDVRFSLASLAKDHECITIEVKGTQVTAVFK